MGLINGVDHVALRVTDLDRATAFYREVLGLTVRGRTAGLAFLGDEDATFLILEGGRDQRAGASGVYSESHGVFLESDLPAPGHDRVLSHVAFRVADVEEARRTLAGRGVRFTTSGERTVAGPPGRYYYFEDPDGNELEVYGPAATRPGSW